MSGRRLPVMTDEELEQLIERAVGRAFDAAGLPIDQTEDRRAAREDFRFLRKMRGAFDGAASKIGYTILLALAGGIIWLVTQGLLFWRQS